MKKFTADFETCTWLEDETYVWAWALCDIDNPEDIQIGTKIEDFFELCKRYNNPKIYFHNLKFDISFVLDLLYKLNFTLIKDRSEAKPNTFQCIVSDLGAFYQCIVYLNGKGKNLKRITFIDSLKIINMSVKDIAKTFNLPISKLEIDYNQYRERENYQLTYNEREYIKNDVKIVAMALAELFKEKLTKSTAAANALGYYKQITGKQKFEHYFPTLSYEEDSLIRPAYKGGFTYLNPIHKDKTLENVYILDVNSLYPSCMLKPMPFGAPVYFKGQYKSNKLYPLYIQTIYCSFKIKPNKIPTIQIKEKNYFFMSNEYIEDSKGERFMLTLTNIDLELFLDHYDVEDLQYIDGFMFRAISGLFDNYINYWTEQKIKAGKEGNKGKRAIAKLQLNSLYGKFAKSTTTRSKYPYLGEDGVLRFTISEAKKENGIYIPVAAFITSYGRFRTISTSQAIKDYSLEHYGEDKYIYSDTDSIHTTLSIEECQKFCEIDDFKLGYWAHEGTAKRGKFVRQKCYIEEFYEEKKYYPSRFLHLIINNNYMNAVAKFNKKYHKIKGYKRPYKLKITCAGLPERCYNQVTWKGFKEGFTAHGKLTYKYVKGGVKLVETDFTIKGG